MYALYVIAKRQKLNEKRLQLKLCCIFFFTINIFELRSYGEMNKNIICYTLHVDKCSTIQSIHEVDGLEVEVNMI